MSAEGRIKYKEERISDDTLSEEIVASLNSSRNLLFNNRLIGVSLNGEAYGNISKRLDPDIRGKLIKQHKERLQELLSGNLEELLSDSLIITASNTGRFGRLRAKDYVVVLHYDPEQNMAITMGEQPSSSETPTHFAMYHFSRVLNTKPEINGVAHGHNHLMWEKSKGRVPSTKEGVEYGTKEMYWEIKRLLEEPNFLNVKRAIMLGHENGILTIGTTPENASIEAVSWYKEIHTS